MYTCNHSTWQMGAGRRRSGSLSATESLSRPRLPETVSKQQASKQAKTTPSLFGERKKRIKERVVGTAVLITFLKKIYLLLSMLYVFHFMSLCAPCVCRSLQRPDLVICCCESFCWHWIIPRASEEQPSVFSCWSRSPALLLSMCFDSKVLVAESFLPI